MSKALSIALAQLNWLVGDLEGNTDKMLATVQEQQHGVDLVMFSELSLCGYPPEDLLYRRDFRQRCLQQLGRLQESSSCTAVLVGHPWWEENKCYNALSLFTNGELTVRYYKQRLPNYGVFDEQRYFQAGEQSAIVEFKGYRLGVLICEDLWFEQPIAALKHAGAELILSINASPFHLGKIEQRDELLQRHCRQFKLPIVYLNQIGGQDELVFDGTSKVFDAQGSISHQLASFGEQTAVVTFSGCDIVPALPPKTTPEPLAQVYQALVLAVRDYVLKNGFKGVLLGLSGGIDSALTLAIAVDALGKEKVQAVMMPFRYTSAISIADAQEQAEILAVKFDIIPIETIFTAFQQQLAPFLQPQLSHDTTEENLQARSRGMLLMALSNRSGSLVLTTGNKSEIAVGYSTLYGDMAGGFDVLKDVPKTWVFDLCRYRNTLSYVIPQRVIDRPPSAELAPDQLDQDSLPPYAVLDEILAGYLEHDLSVEELVRTTQAEEETVRKVIRLVDINEYKRRQAAVGPRVTERNFGKDRRYPITSGFGRQNW